jgi:hypothetical protein
VAGSVVRSLSQITEPNEIAAASWCFYATVISGPTTDIRVPGALALFLLLKEGAHSYLVYPAAVSMYLGLALALYATVILWTDD